MRFWWLWRGPLTWPISPLGALPLNVGGRGVPNSDATDFDAALSTFSRRLEDGNDRLSIPISINQSFIDKVSRIVADMNIEKGASVILGLCNRESSANISDDIFSVLCSTMSLNTCFKALLNSNMLHCSWNSIQMLNIASFMEIEGATLKKDAS